MDTLGIFPIPIAKQDNFLSENDCIRLADISAALDYYKKTTEAKSYRSEERNVLGKYFPELKTSIESLFTDFAYNTLTVKRTCDFKIMGSWSTMTPPGGMSNRHSHCNSFWSGCLYFADYTNPILFHKPILNQIVLDQDVDRITPEHSNEVIFEPSKRSLLLFPSHLGHQVSLNRTNKNRYSLAFNILPNGIFGMHDSITNISVSEYDYLQYE
jgi:uncharacterized protein (TIGR02466 family)